MLASKLLLVPKQLFSIHNYMKAFPAEAVVSRLHGRINVDEHSELRTNQKLLYAAELKQKQNFQKHRVHWEEYTNKYLDVVSKRLDTRSQAPTEMYDKYEYYTKVDWIGGREYNVIFRRKPATSSNNAAATEELVLDIMKIPAIKKYSKTAELVRSAFNDSHTLICFGVDLKNNETVKFMFRDLKTGSVFQERFAELEENQGARSIKNIVFNDDRSIFYVVENADKRPYKVFFKELGQLESRLIYEEKNPEYYLDINKSKDGKYVIITSSTKVNTEVLVIERNSQDYKKLAAKVVFQKSQNAMAFVNSSEGQIYVWTDKDDAYDYKVMKLEGEEDKSKLVDFYLPETGFIIYEVDLFKEYMVLYMRNISASKCRILNLKTREFKDVIVPGEEICTIHPGANQCYDTHQFTFYLSSPFVYNVGYRCQLKDGALTQLDKHQLTGPKFKRDKYEAKIVYAHSIHGNQAIPITLVSQKGIQIKGPQKLLLHVYGFYGLPIDVSYNNIYNVALQQGWTIGYAHVRGGNQKGRKWWKQAMHSNKSLAWQDLLHCVGFLLRHNYTHPALLVLQAGSAGAITVWNIINQHPHLFKAAILNYPFLDVLNSLLDESLPLTVSDHGQFGNPITSMTAYNTIESLCPYQNIRTQEYPLIFIEAGKNDYRCPLYQVIKFASRFRQRAKNNMRCEEVGEKGLLVNIQEDSSHHGSSDLRETHKAGCDIFGYLDYVILQANKELTYK